MTRFVLAAPAPRLPSFGARGGRGHQKPAPRGHKLSGYRRAAAGATFAVMQTKPLAAAFVVAGLIVAGLVPVVAQASTPSAATGAKLQRELDRSVNARVPGAVLVVRHGEHTLRIASGYAELKHKTPMRTSHRFRVGNVTTSFVATVVLQLVAEGKLALDDTVESRLPGAIPTGATITLRQLLNMRSGLFDYLNDGDTTVTSRLLTDPSHRWS
jgi:CubicO group peptidase (beta-lactamase class C family)